VLPPSSSSLIALEAARTFVPGWWLHAFESSVTVPNDPFKYGVSAGTVLPNLDSNELGLLALLLGDIQRQIMVDENQDSEVELEWALALKHLSGVDAVSKDRLGRVFDALPQLRFLVDRGQGKLVSTPLFIGETWFHSDTSSPFQKLSLKPSPFAIELMTGYVDGHLDFLRQVTNFGRLSSINKGRSPLVLWTPVWLELSAPEQVVYARMEAAMQSNGAWLRLDGLVGLSLESLTAGLKLPKKAADSGSLLMDRLRLVGKLGRRLVAHGVMHRDPSPGYMALDSGSQTNSPTLLWQASAERLRSHAEVEYFGLSSSKILRGPITANIKPMCISLGVISGAGVGCAIVLERIWSAIANIPGCGLRVMPGVMLQAHMLFLEWIARSRETSLIPLPKRIREHAVIRICKLSDESNAGRSFRDFIVGISRAEDLANVVEMELDCDAPFSLSIGHCQEAIINLCRSAIFQAEKSNLNPVRDLMSVESFEKNVLELPNKVIPAMPVNRITVKQEHDFASKQDLASQKLRKIAQEELEMMIRVAPESYRELRTKYISTLDSDRKSLLLDVQRRLDSKAFDRQVKPRLVQYMIDHPATWKSAATGYFA
jgi:hypothetical protein